MSNFSAYVEQAIYDWMTQATNMPASPLTIYLGLSTADPLDDGSGLAEPVGGAYAREAITFGARTSTNGVGTSGDSGLDIVFPTATLAWGILTHGAIFDAAVAGNMLNHFQWTVSKNIGVGDTFVVASTDVSLLIR